MNPSINTLLEELDLAFWCGLLTEACLLKKFGRAKRNQDSRLIENFENLLNENEKMLQTIIGYDPPAKFIADIIKTNIVISILHLTQDIGKNRFKTFHSLLNVLINGVKKDFRDISRRAGICRVAVENAEEDKIILYLKERVENLITVLSSIPFNGNIA